MWCNNVVPYILYVNNKLIQIYAASFKYFELQQVCILGYKLEPAINKAKYYLKVYFTFSQCMGCQRADPAPARHASGLSPHWHASQGKMGAICRLPSPPWVRGVVYSIVVYISRDACLLQCSTRGVFTNIEYCICIGLHL